MYIYIYMDIGWLRVLAALGHLLEEEALQRGDGARLGDRGGLV